MYIHTATYIHGIIHTWHYTCMQCISCSTSFLQVSHSASMLHCQQVLHNLFVVHTYVHTWIALLLLACLLCFCVLDNCQTIDAMRRGVEQIFNEHYGMVTVNNIVFHYMAIHMYGYHLIIMYICMQTYMIIS